MRSPSALETLIGWLGFGVLIVVWVVLANAMAVVALGIAAVWIVVAVAARLVECVVDGVLVLSGRKRDA